MARTVLERSDLIPPLAEIFRKHGYDGASIGQIVTQTGAGRSSLYHFFPGGKEEMAEAVLAHIRDWFEEQVFAPLDRLPPVEALSRMQQTINEYFRSGQRICLIGAFALDDTRDLFARELADYFRRWHSALTGCLTRAGLPPEDAGATALAIIAAIQGGIVLARATGNDQAFTQAVSLACPTLS